jgi:hypothetical protein
MTDAEWAQRERKINAIGKVAFWLGMVALALIGFQIVSELTNQAAMESCMSKGFSYDTCFTELNR